MRVQVRFTIPELRATDLAGVHAVVVDVIRATSTTAAALANGARAIFPAASTEDALRLAQSLGREDTLLCGERRGLPIEGYDLGNSPDEFTRAVVEDKRLIMNTTNGTRAFLAVEDADRVFAASFLNLSAVVSGLAGAPSLLILCAGREDTFALEDALCAGAILHRLAETGVALDMDDAAWAAWSISKGVEVNESLLAFAAAGKALAEVGLGSDLAACARVDAVHVLPELRDRSLVAAPGS